MQSKSVAILFVVLLFTSWSSQIDSTGGAQSSEPSTEHEESLALARTVNQFGYNLVKKLMKENENQNIVISPSGITGLLAMTLLGSTRSTYDELATALGFSQDILENRKHHALFGNLLRKLNIDSSNEDDSATNADDIQSSVNDVLPSISSNMPINLTGDLTTQTAYTHGIVVDSNTQIRDTYREYIKHVYDGEAFITHFKDSIEAQQLINTWVKNHTKGIIEEFLSDPLPIETKVVLLSALYFRGQWARPFNPEYTKNMTFHTPTGDVETDMMLNLGKFNYIIKTEYGVHMLALPYNDSSTTMYILQPIVPKQTNLSTALENLDVTTINELIANMSLKDCVVRLPKMELNTKVNLKDALIDLGVRTMFTQDANFALLMDVDKINNTEPEILSRINNGVEESQWLKEAVNRLPNPGVKVDAVLHDVRMTVNEYGTVAVAATSGLLSRTAKLFYADSPFYMFIRNENNKLTTFSAIINDPTKT